MSTKQTNTLIGSGTKYLDGNSSGSTGVGSLWKITDFIFPHGPNAIFKVSWN